MLSMLSGNNRETCDHEAGKAKEKEDLLTAAAEPSWVRARPLRASAAFETFWKRRPQEGNVFRRRMQQMQQCPMVLPQALRYICNVKRKRDNKRAEQDMPLRTFCSWRGKKKSDKHTPALQSNRHSFAFQKTKHNGNDSKTHPAKTSDISGPCCGCSVYTPDYKANLGTVGEMLDINY